MLPTLGGAVERSGSMAMKEGDQVTDPRRPDANRMGYVIRIRRNPACLMRTVVVKWDDGTADEELEEIEFGPLED
jgi:hypothetical protein